MKMTRIASGALVLTLLEILSPTIFGSDVPLRINYQGKVTDPFQTGINEQAEMTFSLYTGASGGVAVWTETQAVIFSDGIFNVLLGKNQPLEPDYFSEHPALFLGVRIRTDPEMTPRQEIASVAYALKTAGISVKGDNVGIGTAEPQARLEINGALRFSADGSSISKAPRVIYTPDTRSGCPPAAAANSDLYTQTFTTADNASVVVMVDTITDYAGRVDTMLYLDGNFCRRTLTSTNSNEWKPVHINWGGTVGPGTHTVSIRSNVANTVGCGSSWGGITTIIHE